MNISKRITTNKYKVACFSFYVGGDKQFQFSSKGQLYGVKVGNVGLRRAGEGDVGD